jgi:hypothetical protein
VAHARAIAPDEFAAGDLVIPDDPENESTVVKPLGDDDRHCPAAV